MNEVLTVRFRTLDGCTRRRKELRERRAWLSVTGSSSDGQIANASGDVQSLRGVVDGREGGALL